jgi:hypothetical protein
VELERKQNTIELEIADEGPGFDYEQFMTLDEERLYDSHGRGILMANSLLDVEYIDPGNRVHVSISIQ